MTLPPHVPAGGGVAVSDLMARLGSLQLQLDAAASREQALREQNADLRGRLVKANLAVEPEPATQPSDEALPEGEPAVSG